MARPLSRLACGVILSAAVLAAAPPSSVSAQTAPGQPMVQTINESAPVPARARLAGAQTVPTMDHSVTVVMDQARILRMPVGVATLVIGNPLIADATIQAGGIMVLTGRGIGSTNLIALNSRGEQIMSTMIRVRQQSDQVVRVFRGPERETLSCTPHCERTLTLGDGKDNFEALIGQVGSRAGAASARAPGVR